MRRKCLARRRMHGSKWWRPSSDNAFSSHMNKPLRSVRLPCVAICIALFAQQGYALKLKPVSADDTVDASSRAQIVNALADKMRDLYVLPEVGERAGKMLKQKLTEGGYDSLKYAVGLASELTRDVQTISHDLHLRVDYGKPLYPSPDNVPTVDEKTTEIKQLLSMNFGVGTAEKLPGNVGYLSMQAFTLPKYAAKPIAVAMSRLADSAALIIDMRQNGGGEPKTVALLSSYLFDKRTHLCDGYGRDGKRKEQFWTTEKVSGVKFDQKKPVYVLISSRTFSAAEEFSYNLKILKRATLVGEVTGGGAHSGDYRRLTDNFYAFIPETRAVNPITKSNWEGTGVEPDIPASALTALLVAQKLVIQTLSATEKDPQKMRVLRKRLSELDSQLAHASGPTAK